MAYFGQTAVLTTKHGKEQVIAPLFAEVLGMQVIVHEADTDQLGTFTGSIPRFGTMEETVIAKAKLGLAATGCEFAIASEGAFGPHPAMPFIPGDTEMMVFIDQKNDFTLIETLVSTETNYDPQAQTDMRAHKNPPRMKVIDALCQKLVQRLACYCRSCGLPGFGLSKLVEGLPCELCKAPTSLVKAEIHACVKCAFIETRARMNQAEYAPSFYCPVCNP